MTLGFLILKRTWNTIKGLGSSWYLDFVEVSIGGKPTVRFEKVTKNFTISIIYAINFMSYCKDNYYLSMQPKPTQKPTFTWEIFTVVKVVILISQFYLNKFKRRKSD